MARSWLARLASLERKAERQRVRRNVRAYRARKLAEGVRRIELSLSERDYLELRASARPNETLGATVARLLTGNRGLPQEHKENQSVAVESTPFSIDQR